MSVTGWVLRVAKNMQILVHRPELLATVESVLLKPGGTLLSFSCPSLVHVLPCCLPEVWDGAPVDNWSDVELSHINSVILQKCGVFQHHRE